MSDLFIIGKVRRNSRLYNGVGEFRGELHRGGTLAEFDKLPRLILSYLVGLLRWDIQ